MSTPSKLKNQPDTVGIEPATFGVSSETPHTRTELSWWLSWQSIGLANQRSRVRFPPWSGYFFSLPGVACAPVHFPVVSGLCYWSITGLDVNTLYEVSAFYIQQIQLYLLV